MPTIGTIVSSRELGFKFSNKMVWKVCPSCERGRWSQLNAKVRLCRECYVQTMPTVLNRPGRKPKAVKLFQGIPRLGEIHFGKELGFEDRNHRFEWKSCPSCGTARWVRRGSHVRLCSTCAENLCPSGPAHPSWRGGMTVQRGYVVIHSPNHPNRDANGYVKRCRLVLEKSLGKVLTGKVDVHHINGIKSDDRLENLAVLTRAEHRRLHMKGGQRV